MATSTIEAVSAPMFPNGVSTEFPFTFDVPTVDELLVVLMDSLGALTIVDPSAYTVTLNPTSGGTVTFSAAPASGPTLFVLLDPLFTQEILYTNGAAFTADPTNEGLDRSAYRDRYLLSLISRAILVPIGELGFTLPPADVRGGGVLVFDEDGDPVVLPIGGSGLSVLQPVTVSETPPVDPQVGDLWWKSDEGRLKVYYDDGDSQQWVDSNPVPIPADAAEGATASEILIGSDSMKFVSPAAFREATAPAALTDAATIAVDFEAGRNFTVTLAGNRTLGNPTNVQAGDSGTIYVIQDGTGSRTLTLDTNWKPIGGAPTLSTGAGAVDVLAYFARSATEITLSYIGAEG